MPFSDRRSPILGYLRQEFGQAWWAITSFIRGMWWGGQMPRVLQAWAPYPLEVGWSPWALRCGAHRERSVSPNTNPPLMPFVSRTAESLASDSVMLVGRPDSAGWSLQRCSKTKPNTAGRSVGLRCIGSPSSPIVLPYLSGRALPTTVRTAQGVFFGLSTTPIGRLGLCV